MNHFLFRRVFGLVLGLRLPGAVPLAFAPVPPPKSRDTSSLSADLKRSNLAATDPASAFAFAPAPAPCSMVSRRNFSASFGFSTIFFVCSTCFFLGGGGRELMRDRVAFRTLHLESAISYKTLNAGLGLLFFQGGVSHVGFRLDTTKHWMWCCCRYHRKTR